VKQWRKENKKKKKGRKVKIMAERRGEIAQEEKKQEKKMFKARPRWADIQLSLQLQLRSTLIPWAKN
jgi:hypothetical protein